MGYSLHGFNIVLGSGRLITIKDKNSAYYNKTMIEIPFRLNYRKGKFAKKFPVGYYRPILRGKEQRSYGSADSAFSDSLLNLTLAPKSEKTGFVRIPYTGPGDYGVRLIFNQWLKSVIITDYYDKDRLVQDKIRRERAMKAVKNNNSKHDIKKPNKAPSNNKKTRIKTIRLDRKNFGKPLGVGGKRKWPLPEED